MEKSFVHLHNHTEYSMLDGAQKLTPMFTEVARQEMPAVAMSDHGNLFGAYDFYSTSQKFPGVKPVIGIEAYVAPSSRLNRKREFFKPGGARPVSDDMEATKDVSGGGRYTHMTMWARNAQGLRNLFRLSTEASYTGQYPVGKPRMDMNLIAEHAGGIIGTTGCPSGAVQTRLRLGQYKEARTTAAAYQDILGRENYFLELMDHGLSIESQVRSDLLRLAKELQIPLLATNDAHYVHSSQADAHDNLLCIGTGKNKADEKRFRFSGTGYYLKSAAEMRELFAELPEACDNTLLIAERVEPYDDVFTMVDEMPDYPGVPDGVTQEQWLRQECLKGLEKRYGTPLPAEVVQRFETEMSVIGPMGFSSYFLIVADICRHARASDIPVGPGRGSATGSIVAYATRITELCPLEHGLLFERFLNPERINPPDVDLDFDDRQREQMVRYVSEKYGAEYTSMVITFGRIKAKNAIKDAARILQFPYQQGEKITKALPPDVNGHPVPLNGVLDSGHPRYEECGDVREMYLNESDAKEIIDTARGVEGLVRGTGVHAAAVIISKTPLVERIPLQMRAKDEARIAGFDYPSCESLGLLKMDFLGLRNLGIIDHALKIIQKNRGIHLVTVDPMDEDPGKKVIPLDDKKTFNLLAKGDTLGVFQLDGGGMRALLKLMEPSRFEDIAAALALYRPGPMAANAHTSYALRQNGKQNPDPIHPELKDALDPILGSTHHLLVYQEQIMAVARELAGYTLGGADMLRRAMGKKKAEVLEAEWDKFRTGMEDKGYSPEAVRAIWDVMLPFSGYAFNKSHTAGYGLISYWTAYLKANYPAEYMAALLTSVEDDKDKAGTYLADARRLGIKVLPPDVNESVGDFTAVGDAVRFGLRSVRNVGDGMIEAVVKARESKGAFTSFEDYLDKVNLPGLNKKALESMVKGGAFDSLGHSRKGLSAACGMAVDAAAPGKKAASYGQDDLFSEQATGIEGGVPFSLPVEISADEWPRKILLSMERQMLGLYVSAHPLDGTEHILSQYRDSTVVDLIASDRTEGGVRLAGLLSNVQHKVTKQNKPYAIVTLADRDGEIEVLFFSGAYTLASSALIEDSVVSVQGRINERDGAISIFGNEVRALDVSSAGTDGAPLIRLSFPAAKVTPESVAELKRILHDHPGKTDITLVVSGPRRTTVYQLDARVDKDRVEPEVMSAFGVRCIQAAD